MAPLVQCVYDFLHGFIRFPNKSIIRAKVIAVKSVNYKTIIGEIALWTAMLMKKKLTQKPHQSPLLQTIPPKL